MADEGFQTALEQTDLSSANAAPDKMVQLPGYLVENAKMDGIKDLGRQVLSGAVDPFVKIGQVATGQSETPIQDATEAALGLVGPKIGFGASIFAGVGSKTANRLTLNTAQRLEQESVNPETVTRVTGWYKDSDKMWKYEIPSTSAKMIDIDKAPMSGKMGDYLDFPELYRAYPTLKDYKVKLDSNLDSMGLNDAQKKLITINPKKVDNKEFMFTMLHELQHAVQAKEKFTYGTSPEGVEAKLNNSFVDRLQTADPKETPQLLDLWSEVDKMKGDLFDYLYRANPGEREANLAALRHILSKQQLQAVSPVEHMKWLEEKAPKDFPKEFRFPDEVRSGNSAAMSASK